MKLSQRPAAQINLIGGRLSLDFVNTVSGWIPDPLEKRGHSLAATARDDKLVDYADLLAWSWRAGLLTENEAQSLAREAGRREKEAAAVLTRAVQLREAIHRLCLAMIKRTAPRSVDLELLNRELNTALGRVRLVPGKGNFLWEWSDGKKALDRMLWLIADSAAELLTTGDLTRLRECGGENCSWLFEDVSKNRRRQWCEMETCGNLAKVRRFRQRQRS